MNTRAKTKARPRAEFVRISFFAPAKRTAKDVGKRSVFSALALLSMEIDARLSNASSTPLKCIRSLMMAGLGAKSDDYLEMRFWMSNNSFSSLLLGDIFLHATKDLLKCQITYK